MDLKTHVKSVIEHMTCTTHHQKTLLVIVESDIKMVCCCDDFKIKCFNAMLEVLLDRKAKSLDVSWKSTD